MSNLRDRILNLIANSRTDEVAGGTPKGQEPDVTNPKFKEPDVVVKEAPKKVPKKRKPMQDKWR